MDEVKEFIENVKEGHIRGDYITTRVDENIFLEVSVASFQYGNINVRLWVQDDNIEPEQDMNYRRICRIDSKYKTVQNTVQELLNEQNESEVSVIFEPELNRPTRATDNPEMVPNPLDVSETYSFEAMVTIRDDVSMAEALMTNREDGMTREEVERLSDED